MSKKICVLSGAGISAESGLKTFRDSGGLWEGYDVHEVATPEAWATDPELVLRFYNERRKQVREVNPNAAHLALAELETKYQVEIITQNIDDLHERAGSSNVLHLHGEILKSKTNENPDLLYNVDRDIELGDLDSRGDQLRPHVVWFGESVPEMSRAVPLVEQADIVIVVGTSLVVYPAAGLISFSRPGAERYLIDPGEESERASGQVGAEHIQENATIGVPELVSELLS